MPGIDGHDECCTNLNWTGGFTERAFEGAVRFRGDCCLIFERHRARRVVAHFQSFDRRFKKADILLRRFFNPTDVRNVALELQLLSFDFGDTTRLQDPTIGFCSLQNTELAEFIEKPQRREAIANFRPLRFDGLPQPIFAIAHRRFTGQLR